jgi:V/A-type H+/Na+-transporting ATPase subunit I
MIEKMSKITLLVEETRADKTLKDLRKLGVLHVSPLANPPSADMSGIAKRIGNAKKALLLLGEIKDVKQRTHPQAQKLVTDILKIGERRSVLKDEMDNLLQAQSWYENWGHVSLEHIRYLQDHHYSLKLYIAPKAEVEEELSRDNVFVLSESKTVFQLALLAQEDDETLPFQQVSLPDIARDEVEKRLKEIRKELTSLEKELDADKAYAGSLEALIKELEKEHRFAEVRNGLGTEEIIVYLQGYVPSEDAVKIEKAAEKHAWGYVEEEPSMEEQPPTKLKNSRWIGIIQPVFDFLGTVPGYYEKDISIYFLMFFTVFVAMIIGDAGYGLLFLALAVTATVKTKKAQKKKKLPDFIVLLYVLSMATIIWGAVTGNWFGSLAIASVPFFKSLIIPQISSFPELFPDMQVNPQDKVMLICFSLAAIHLSLASVLNFIDNLPKLKAFEHVGWLFLTVGLFPLVLNLVLNIPMFGFELPLIIAGFLFVLIFSRQEEGKSFLKGALAGLGGAFKTFLDAISSFSNIISYIRLFAVGMATVAIASSFNGIAAQMNEGPAIIGAVIILIIGHGLNIIMALLSVVVHGIRLNVLEFSGQLGLEWTGYKYQPFKD